MRSVSSTPNLIVLGALTTSVRTGSTYPRASTSSLDTSAEKVTPSVVIMPTGRYSAGSSLTCPLVSVILSGSFALAGAMKMMTFRPLRTLVPWLCLALSASIVVPAMMFPLSQ